jgi:hypothetical protein
VTCGAQRLGATFALEIRIRVEDANKVSVRLVRRIGLGEEAPP